MSDYHILFSDNLFCFFKRFDVVVFFCVHNDKITVSIRV